MPMQLINGDCLEELKKLKPNSIDAMITDPPAAIAFMGKKWDGNRGSRDNWIAWLSDVLKECGRVLKPGAHVFVWALPKTSHWTAMALENANYEVRDVVTHLFGSGFPKSLDIGKAVDREFGAIYPKNKPIAGNRSMTGANYTRLPKPDISTPQAKQWDGWGTALKPASEHWILARVPLSHSSVHRNVLKWNTGGINIDASRISLNGEKQPTGSGGPSNGSTWSMNGNNGNITSESGRFPANVVLSGDAIDMLDKQSGVLKSGDRNLIGHNKPKGSTNFGGSDRQNFKGDQGGASRFFYCAKPSKSERNAGLEGMPKQIVRNALTTHNGTGNYRGVDKKPLSSQENTHPTVKPLKLMRYLIKMITPPGGIVLDPFMGSGTTGSAAVSLGFDFIGIEREKEYYEIASKRIGVRNGH